MEQKVIFNDAKHNIKLFFNEEFKNFDSLLLSHFLNRFNDFLNYNEEGITYKPKFIFTNNIDSLLKPIEKSFKLPIYEDDNASNFNQRLKPIIALGSNEWCIYIEMKDGKINYGLCKVLNSIKDKDLLTLIQESETLKEKQDKIFCIIAKCVNFYIMDLVSLRGNRLTVNFSLDPDKQLLDTSDISQFVDATFSKLRTTRKKLSSIKTMYTNIFTKVINEVNGAICVVVDKEYKDNGFFEDGIWLKEPISFNKLFTNSKSYSEEKLQAFVHLFMAMLQFDGITVVDNFGRIRGYNIFVQTDNKKNKNIVGGARKRAAYSIINSRRKHIIGVYFQSHEGEIFYRALKIRKPNASITTTQSHPITSTEHSTREEPNETCALIQSIPHEIETEETQKSSLI